MVETSSKTIIYCEEKYIESIKLIKVSIANTKYYDVGIITLSSYIRLKNKSCISLLKETAIIKTKSV